MEGWALDYGFIGRPGGGGGGGGGGGKRGGGGKGGGGGGGEREGKWRGLCC